MTAAAPGETVPGIGTFFVGIDVAPGRYRCAEAKGGWWVRFTGPGGGEPVGSWPLPPGPAEVDISPTDFAFETHVASHWERVGAPLGPPARALPGEARPVADPTLRADLDSIVRRGRPLVWLGPLALLALGAGAAALLGMWLVPVALVGALLWAIVPGVTLDARRARELDRRRDRYVVPEDLDAPARALLARAQRAIDTVLTAEVHREGLLDAIDNTVTLPRQEWEIAQILARQARLRTARDADAVEDELPEVEAALRPLREKLDRSVAAVTRRVEALERYAERAVAADEALRAQRRLEALTRDAHEYDALLADATRDELAIPAIERLTEQGDALVRALRERLAAAAEAGGDLPLPVDPPAEP